MAHLHHRRKDIVEGPVSASLFFESSKACSNSPVRKTSYSKIIRTSLLSLTATIFRLLLILTVFLNTIPLIICLLDARWPLPIYFGTICKPGFPGNSFPVVSPSAALSSLFDRVTTIEVKIGQYKPIRNFAHFGDGARVLPEITSLTHGMKDNNWLYGSPPVHDFVYKNPLFVVSDDQISVGSCWEIDGSAGILGILLSEPVELSAISIDSIHPSLVSTTSYARHPQAISLWGMLPNSSISLPTATEVRHAKQFLPNFIASPKSYVKAKDEFVHLLSIHYDPEGTATNQVFKLPSRHWAAHVIFQAVLVEILENRGGNTTCLYRLRIHGRV